MQWVDGIILLVVISLLLLALRGAIRHFKGNCSCHTCDNKKGKCPDSKDTIV